MIDDFAHHPTAVRETIYAIRLRYPERRLWAVFEPRSNTSRRNIHQKEYAESFDGAQRVSLKVPEPHDKVPLNEQLDVPAVADSLRHHGIDADYSADVSELVNRVAGETKRGDVVLVMSNGAFGGFIPSLLGAIGAVLLTYWTALAFVSRRAAVLAAMMFATSILLGVEARLAKMHSHTAKTSNRPPVKKAHHTTAGQL